MRTPNYGASSTHKRLSAPIVGLMVVMSAIYCPLIYDHLPFLGQIRIVTIAAVFSLVTYVGTHNRYSNVTALRNPIVLAWVAFIIVMFLGLLDSYDRGMTLRLVIVNIKLFLIFLIMIKIIDSQERLDLVLALFVSASMVMAVSTIYNYYFNPGILRGGFRGIATEEGIFADPNDLAMLFVVALPFAIYFLLVKDKKIIPLIAILTLTIAVILTFSRGGFLGLCMVAIAVVWFFARSRRKYVLFFAALFILIWLFAPEGYKDRIGTITTWQVDEKTGLTGTRMDSWKNGITEGMKHPILGVGAGGSAYVSGTTMRDWHAVHNIFIMVFVDHGFFGLALYLSLFIIPMKQYKTSIQTNDASFARLQVLSATLLISLVAFATTGFFLPQSTSPLMYTITGIVVITGELWRKIHAKKVDAFSSTNLRWPSS